MTKIEILKHPPDHGKWYILDVMKRRSRGRDWVALLIDVEPTLFAADHTVRAQHAWLDLGRHASLIEAWSHAEDLAQTKH